MENVRPLKQFRLEKFHRAPIFFGRGENHRAVVIDRALPQQNLGDATILREQRAALDEFLTEVQHDVTADLLCFFGESDVTSDGKLMFTQLFEVFDSIGRRDARVVTGQVEQIDRFDRLNGNRFVFPRRAIEKLAQLPFESHERERRLETVTNVKRQMFGEDVGVNDVRLVRRQVQQVIRQQFADAEFSVIRSNENEAEHKNCADGRRSATPLFQRAVSEMAELRRHHVRMFRPKGEIVNGKIDRRTTENRQSAEDLFQLGQIRSDHRPNEQIQRFDIFVSKRHKTPGKEAKRIVYR